jgi:LEA14-like dessication related protein
VKRLNWLLVLSVLLFIRCESLKKLQNMADVKTPEASFEKVKVSGLSFEKADLLFDIKIVNPNDFNITLNGFDYDLLINKNSFLSGKQNEAVAVNAGDSSVVQIPLSINYKELYRTYKSLRDRDTLEYTLKTGLLFAVPVLGNVRIPVSKSGRVPSLKIPSISIKSLKLNRIGFSGADLTLEVAVDNPNTVKLLLDKMNFNLNINNQSWASGTAAPKSEIKEKSETALDIAVHLDLMQMGRSVYRLLQGNSELKVEFKGDAAMSSTLELLKNFNLSFDEMKNIKLTK